MGETDTIHVTVNDVIYNLWGIKDPNYVMSIMDTGGRPLEDYTFKDTVIRCK